MIQQSWTKDCRPIHEIKQHRFSYEMFYSWHFAIYDNIDSIDMFYECEDFDIETYDGDTLVIHWYSWHIYAWNL